MAIEELEVSHHNGQKIIEVVRDPARQLTEGLHPLGLNEGSLRLLAAPDLGLELERPSLHARLELRVAARQEILHALAIGDIPEHRHEHAPAAHLGLGDRSFSGELRTVLPQGEAFLTLAHLATAHCAGSELAPVLAMQGAKALGNEPLERLADHLAS